MTPACCSSQRDQPGYFISEVSLLYRKWPGQMTSQASHTDDIELPARMTIIEQRAKALGELWTSSQIESATQPHGFMPRLT